MEKRAPEPMGTSGCVPIGQNALPGPAENGGTDGFSSLLGEALMVGFYQNTNFLLGEFKVIDGFYPQPLFMLGGFDLELSGGASPQVTF